MLTGEVLPATNTDFVLPALIAVTVNTFTELSLIFLPVMLLIMNVVTNGVQDIALSFEKGEGLIWMWRTALSGNQWSGNQRATSGGHEGLVMLRGGQRCQSWCSGPANAQEPRPEPALGLGYRFSRRSLALPCPQP